MVIRAVERDSFYTGQGGKAYFDSHFDERETFGRRYQSRYFRSFCGDNRVLLDYGCGDGTLLRSLPAQEKYGVEINEVCARKISALNEGESTPIRLFSDLSKIPHSVADVAISNHCLEHVLHPLESLRELRRVLKPGGHLVIVTPFDDCRNAIHKTWMEGDENNHLQTWSPRNLGNLGTKAGFTVSEARAFTFACSKKLYWVHNWLGDSPFRFACILLGWVKRKREVRVVARAE